MSADGGLPFSTCGFHIHRIALVTGSCPDAKSDRERQARTIGLHEDAT